MDYNLWQQLINSNIGQRATLPIQYLFGDRDKAEQFWNEDMGRFGDLLLSTTKPFRTGANILAQNWGSALTGKDMSQEENQGKFLQWLAGGLTDEEQQVISDKPYLSALKSGAGMASTLAPFASQSLRTIQFAANPLKNRLAQLLSQGGLEGTMGGLGWSREGKEVQDMLTGGLIGAGGEVAMDYLVNPQFRQMLGDAMTTPDAMGRPTYRGSFGEDVDISGLRERAFKSANISDQPTQMTNMTNTRVLDSIQDDIERISNAPHTQEGLEYLQEVQRLYGDTLKNTIDMPLRVYDLPGNPDNYANLIDTTGDSNAKVFVNTDVPEQTYQNIDEPIINNWMDNIDESPEIGLLKDDPIAQLEVDARYYSTPEEFVKAKEMIPVYRGQDHPDFTAFDGRTKDRFLPGMKGTSFATSRSAASNYGDYIVEGYVDKGSLLKRQDIDKEVLNSIDKKIKSFDLGDYGEGYEFEEVVSKIADIAKEKGKGAINLGDFFDRSLIDDEIRVISKDSFFDKNQLQDIWKRAHPNELGNSLRGGFKEILKKSGLK